MPNQTRQPDANKRRRTFADVPVFTELADAAMALLTLLSLGFIRKNFPD